MIQKRIFTAGKMAMTFEPGRILLASFPFSDHAAGKLRPILVVSASAFNKGEDFIAVPISSRPDADGYKINSMDSYFPDTKLKSDSTVRWSKVMVMSSTLVTKQLGEVPKEVLTEIQGRIRGIFS